jgi:hypothetical protein
LEKIGTRCDVTPAADETGEGERRRRREKRYEENDGMRTPLYT